MTKATAEQLRENIAQSRRHIAKQEGVIARLLDQKHADLATDARKLLTTMHEHLQTEMEMLASEEATETGT